MSRTVELACAAELLWEVTFHGFSAKDVDASRRQLEKIADMFDVADSRDDDIQHDAGDSNDTAYPKEVVANDLTYWLNNVGLSINKGTKKAPVIIAI